MVLLQHKRDELFHYLRALANPDYQQKVWVEKQYPPNLGHDSFGYVITFFFEDTMLAEAPEKNVGTILASRDEVPVIAQVATALGNLLYAMGDQCTDEEYIRAPHWKLVVSAASQAVVYYNLDQGAHT